MTRSQAREQAFIIVFEKIFNPEESAALLIEAAQECGLFTADEFTSKLCEAACGNIEETDGTISAFLKGWKIQRLSKITLAILRLAISEINYFDDVPASVTVNEAVELAKKYGGAEDAPFINGVLGAFLRSKEEK